VTEVTDVRSTVEHAPAPLRPRALAFHLASLLAIAVGAVARVGLEADRTRASPCRSAGPQGL
jgi:hypothetical protein